MLLLHGLAILLLLSTVGMVWAKKIASAVKILALQALLLALIAVVVAIQTGLRDLYVIAFLTVTVKGIFIPVILYVTLQRTSGQAETVRWGGRQFSVLSASALVAVGYFVTRHVPISLGSLGHLYLPIAVSMMLIGLFVMGTQQKALMQGMGLVVMENGLFLLALATTYGIPFLVDVGVFLDVLVAVILVSVLTYRIHGTFQTTNTENLRKLRG